MKGISRLAVVAVVILAVGICTLGDGDTRPASAGEKACAGKTLGGLCGAIPPPSAGWSVVRRSDANPPSYVAGTRPVPMDLVCEQDWQDKGKIQAAQSASMNAMANVKPDKSAEAAAAAAQKKFEQVMAAVTAAAQKNDQAEMKRLQPEMDAASKAYQAAMLAQNKGMMDAVAKAKTTDSDAKIRVEANTGYEFLEVTAQETVAPGVTGYRVAGRNDEEGTTWVFLGPWQITKDRSSTRFQIRPLQGPPCAVVSVVVRVDATQPRALAILQKVDWNALRALIK